MSHFLTPERIVCFLLGGTAIWLGTSCWSGAAATELDQAPVVAGAPDAVSPLEALHSSLVPAASLVNGQASYWDNGPVGADLLCEVGCPYEYQYCDHESNDADGLVDRPEQSVYRDTESAGEDLLCDYDEVHYEYEYDYDSEISGMAVDGPSASRWDNVCDEDPSEYVGYDSEEGSEWTAMEDGREIEIDLFAWQPSELLESADLDLIRSLQRLSKASIARQRARLNEYIESLGFEAIDLAYRYEAATRSDVLRLASDLPGAAAFLASYRLIEQDRIGIDQGVALLTDSLSDQSPAWVESVGRIAAASEGVVSETHPVVDALVAAAYRSAAALNSLLSAVSGRVAGLPWAELSGRLQEIRSAFRPLRSGDGSAY